MKSNKDKLVCSAVCASIHHPTMPNNGYRIGYDGYGRITHGTGSITYNYKIGDSCMGIEGDHIEPGVSVKNANQSENNAVQFLSCIGNIAIVTSGEAKGSKGIVTGKHGGVDHTIIYFENNVLDKLNIDDKIKIKTFGLGYKLLDFKDVSVMNIDPDLLEKIITTDTKININVSTIIPSFLMGSGLGSNSNYAGDYDIMTQDKEANSKFGIDTLRFGDIVAISDHYCRNGAHFKKDYITIGVIVHSDSFTSGHGPGITTIMSAHKDNFNIKVGSSCNLIDFINK